MINNFSKNKKKKKKKDKAILHFEKVSNYAGLQSLFSLYWSWIPSYMRTYNDYVGTFNFRVKLSYQVTEEFDTDLVSQKIGYFSLKQDVVGGWLLWLLVLYQSLRVHLAEWLALLTFDHDVPSSSAVRGGIQLMYGASFHTAFHYHSFIVLMWLDPL